MSHTPMKDSQDNKNSPTIRTEGWSRQLVYLKRWSLPVLALVVAAVIASVLWGKLHDDVWAYFSDGEGTRVEVQEDKARMVLWEDPKPNYFQEKSESAEAKQADPVNGPAGQFEASFFADGTRMILVRWDKSQTNADLYQSSWDGRFWSRPEAIQSINTAANERGPGLSSDGKYLYFSSDRKGGLGGYDLYVARWDGKDWTGVESLGASVNSAADEAGPALSADDSQLYFSSKRASAGVDDIYLANRIVTQPKTAPTPDAKAKIVLPEIPAFSPAEPVTELNSAASDLRAALSRRGDHVFLASDRDRNKNAGFGIYFSRIIGGKSLPPERVDLYIDKGDVTDPAVRMDGFDLLFSADSKAAAALEGSENPAEGYRLYRTTTREVFGYTNLSRWMQFGELLNQIGWRLLLALAALVALIYLLERWQDLTSLYHKCLAGSAAVHLLILLLMMIWQITQNLDTGGEPQAADIAISIEALAQEELALESTPEEAKLSDTKVAVVTDKIVSDFVIPDFKPVQPSDAPPIVTSTAKESMIQDVRASKENESSTSESVPVPSDQRELASSLPESQLPEPELPTLPELTSAEPAVASEPADSSKDLFRPTKSVPKVGSEQAKKTLDVAEKAVQKSTQTKEISLGSSSAATTDTGGAQIIAHAGLEAQGAPPKMEGVGSRVTTLLNISGSDSTTDPLLPGKLEMPKHEIDPQALTKSVQKQRGRPSLETIEALGGSDASEKGIGAALDWLARNQEADGRWDTRKHGAKDDYDTAGTGSALLCFYGWGLSHTADGKYQTNIKKALDWLVAQQKEDGDLSGGGKATGRMYCHGIATIALCEAYGATKDPKLKVPAEKAIALILASQSPSKGGWRYEPAKNGVPSKDSDTSVTGWQYMALHSAKMADIQVPQSAFDLAGKWFAYAGGGKHGGLYGYDGPSRSNPAMVATGMFCRQLDLVPPTEPMMQESADLLKMHSINPKAPDLYHVYYATLALYQHQGPVWLAWNEKLKEILPLIQRKDGAESGSWNPTGQHIVPGGRVISTAFATLSLEVYYRLLPMYGFRNEDAPPAKVKIDK